ncbi:YlbL family protein [Nocardioides nanhaiensis]|uniref:PDZ domain-containing protein n=1 Tax=Nocardioides nanhaiensis TaxID=1476871 RepID=A0ABP8W1P5_9ACTN
MNQRLIAAMVAAPLVLGLLLSAAFVPLPYVVYRPGLTVDVLGAQEDGREIVQVDGAESYPHEGQLRMTTVTVTPPKPAKVNLLELMTAWVDGQDAVVPYDNVYRPDETQEENDQEGAAQMSGSQNAAVGVALTELGYDVRAVGVADVEPDGPADGVLRAGDVVTAVGGEPTAQPEQLIEAVGAATPGEPLELSVQRGSGDRELSITPERTDGQTRIGISVAPTFTRFPVDVQVGIPPQISGPSAGLIFSLAIYDTMTPGSLVGDHTVAGTGEIFDDGSVGPIGGIDQKIAGARRDGADLFLVPADNCADAADADPGDMRLVLATTMHEARLAIEEWVEDPDADLPSCEDLESATAGAAA